MRFGRSKEQRQSEKIAKLVSWNQTGIRKFAWRPVKLEDDTWLLFEYYRSFLQSRNYHNLALEGGPLFWIRWKQRFNNSAEADLLVEKLKG